MTIVSIAAPDGATEWKRLVAEYRAAVAARDAVTPPADVMDAGEEEEAAFEASLDASYKALKTLCEFPSPTFAALAEKVEIISTWYPDACHLDGSDAAYIIADVRQLAAREA